MPCYPVYGALLESTMTLPELVETTPAPAHWSFRTDTGAPGTTPGVELGADLIYGECHARLSRHDAGHRIAVDDTGVFDLSEDRRRVVWYHRADAWPEFVRAHLLNRVLGTALFLDGLLPLHASAVTTAEGTIAFLAPKGFGKSTLALALHSLGAGFVSDDTLPVDPTDPVVVRPGIPSARVREDALHVLGVAPGAATERDGKRLLSFGAAARGAEPLRLRALYLLDPAAASDEVGPHVERRPLSPALNAISVIAHVKIGRMLGPQAAQPMLERAAQVLRSVPVFSLRVPRALDLLRPTAERILSWHGGTG
ncbi:MAG: hypothetical protein JNL44_15320 [Gemmatimonadetes bacterium]|nr:hypothetical protein [Gemmatimonadota bacterium]